MQGRAGMNYQFIMEFLFKVMKKTWLLPPDRTEAKNTCDKEKSPHGGMDVIMLPIVHIQRTKLLQSTALCDCLHSVFSINQGYFQVFYYSWLQGSISYFHSV